MENLKAYAEKELLKTQLEIQEQTFQYISREIHDNIGQFISLAKLQLNTVDFTQPDVAEDKVYHSTDLLTKALKTSARSFEEPEFGLPPQPRARCGDRSTSDATQKIGDCASRV